MSSLGLDKEHWIFIIVVVGIVYFWMNQRSSIENFTPNTTQLKEMIGIIGTISDLTSHSNVNPQLYQPIVNKYVLKVMGSQANVLDMMKSIQNDPLIKNFQKELANPSTQGGLAPPPPVQVTVSPAVQSSTPLGFQSSNSSFVSTVINPSMGWSASDGIGQPVTLQPHNPNSATQKFKYDGKQITNSSGKCLDVPSSDFTNGNHLQLWDCNGTGAQQFSFSNGVFTSKSNPGKCIDLAYSSSAPGTPIQIWDCNSTDAQKWLPGPA